MYVKVFLRGKGLFNHLTSGKSSIKSSERYSAKANPTLNYRLDQDDNAIIRLIISNIEPHIGSSALYMSTAKQI